MKPQSYSIGVKGSGMHMGMYISHVSTNFPKVTIYERSAWLKAFRQQEVDLGRQGYLDAEGTEHAKRIAENMAKPIEDDATLEFKTTGTQLIVIITCKDGKKQQVEVQPYALVHPGKTPAFAKVDAAVAQCVTKRPMS